MASRSRTNVMYIYDLPYTERDKINRILDQDNKWEELAGKYMKYSMMEIRTLRQEFLRRGSPTDELLTKWGHSNHTVAELFILLSKMHHYQSMRILKPFVDPKYHPLIHEGEKNLTQLFNAQPVRKLTPPGVSPTNHPKCSPNGSDEEGLMSFAGAVIPAVDPSNKTMGFDRHNLNVAHTPTLTPAVNKIHLPDPAREEKIINVAKNAENVRPQTNQNQIPTRKLSSASDASTMAESCGSIPHIPYKELEAATQGWDKQNILGKGGFGTVFKGNWKHTQVAIKRIEQRGAESAESYRGLVTQSLRELRILNSCRHDNILPVYGYSVNGEEPCLVYQFMSNGTLEDRLLCRKESRPINWLQRHNIAEGTARGLQFLHNYSQTPFIHGDIKSANILLDVNMEPRIGDFGLAREGPQGQYTHLTVSRVHGTRPYLPDEFMRNKKLSPEVDTFSFGIVLFELASGQRAYDDRRPKKFLIEYVESLEENQLHTLVDQKAGFDNLQTFSYFIKLGKWCSSRLPRDRPKMETVLRELAGMTQKRLIMAGAQGLPSPSSPYGIQVFHDQRNSQMKQQLSPGMVLQPASYSNGKHLVMQGESNVHVLTNVKHPKNPLVIYTPPQEAMMDRELAASRIPLNIPITGSRNLTQSPTANWTAAMQSPSPQPPPSPSQQSPKLPTSLRPTAPSSIASGPGQGSDRDTDTTTSDEEESLPPTASDVTGPPHAQPENSFIDNGDVYLPNLSLLQMRDSDFLDSRPAQESSAHSTLQSFQASATSIKSSVSDQPTAKGKSLIFLSSIQS